MVDQHPHSRAGSPRSFGLAQMSAQMRVAIVIPAIAGIWVILWLLVRA